MSAERRILETFHPGLETKPKKKQKSRQSGKRGARRPRDSPQPRFPSTVLAVARAAEPEITRAMCACAVALQVKREITPLFDGYRLVGKRIRT
ncbi:hypothetical protein CEXT_26461 [Caerostris extrusa]|uniref:Uncharacterized protein n=1 Tax=Caerostris extrusa TaxID=172846 RepID=A0AAV4VZV8_CAEEX|nr:hypothetical protein CEXT_26461 [Caerostris extrusa]